MMKVLYQDNQIVVVVKPQGVQSEAGDHSVPQLLLPQFGTVYTVHRLDTGTGGVMVYARTKEAASALGVSMAKSLFRKEYIAVVSGTPSPACGDMQDFLFHDRHSNKSFSVGTERRGAKEAILHYRTLDVRQTPAGTLSRVFVTLETGRTHQIRVQFATRGMPLVGDGKYGSRVRAPYPALFASRLTFPHPISGEKMDFVVPQPDSFPFHVFTDSHLEIEHKYLIRMPDIEKLAAMPDCRVMHLIQTYLRAPAGETHRVREVTEEGRVSYVETRKKRVNDLRCVEEERQLSRGEYLSLLQEREENCRPISKTRYCVPWQDKKVEIDIYPFWQDRATAEIEVESENVAVTLPPYLTLIREVTDDKRYKNVNLAHKVPMDAI